MKYSIEESFHLLKNYCEKEQFKGYDPFDGLNSSFFQALPFIKNNRFLKLIWIQSFKRSPYNLRKLFGVKKDFNSKGLALFLIGYCNLYEAKEDKKNLEKIEYIANKLIDLQSKAYSGACWGYNFDWQARAFFQPKNTPTVVATSFVVEALLRAHVITKDKKLLDVAVSSAQFVLNNLNRTYDNKGNFAFSYSPQDSSQVFNASLLGAKLLSQIYIYTKDNRYLETAKKAVSYVCSKQKEDGSWSYGTLPFHQWIDSFHTGFNLECIDEYQKVSGDTSFSSNLQKGIDYYINNFFTKEGISKYYNDSIYPIDVHAPAQLLVCLSKLDLHSNHKELIDNVLRWTIKNMQDPKGYFYYQKWKYFTNKIPYIRWTQAWMFYALSFVMLNIEDE